MLSLIRLVTAAVRVAGYAALYNSIYQAQVYTDTGESREESGGHAPYLTLNFNRICFNYNI